MNGKTGGQIIIKCCEQQGVTHIFGYPGGANIPIFDALIDSSIKLILTRHEQGATHMADGYARVTGKPGVVLVTSGPGATNTITGILTAQMDSIPLVILTGQTVTASLGLDAFQEADVSGISYPVVKHSYLLKDVNEIPRVFEEAFFLARSGRPGPVLIDIPKDISSAILEPGYNLSMDLPGYTIPDNADRKELTEIATAMKAARQPLIMAGHGALISGAEREVLTLAEKIQAPVVTTLLGKGAFPDSHPLCLGMLGMHGTAYANMAVKNADLILSIGSRWDDRILGKPALFAMKACKIHIDIDPAEHNKSLNVDYFICADAKRALQDLMPLVSKADTKEWLKQVNDWKEAYPLAYDNALGLTAQHVIKTMYELSRARNPVVVTDVGQHQMWAAQFFKVEQPHNWLSSGGAGTMGFGFPAAIGAQFARPEALVIAIVGDGGFQMTEAELSTAANHKLPLKVVVIDNKYLGMVRQWQNLFFDNRLSGVRLDGNPDFVKLAGAYGIKGLHLGRVEDAERVLKEALDYNEGPCLVHAEVVLEENVFPMIPAGASYDEMLISEPTKKLAKPEGST